MSSTIDLPSIPTISSLYKQGKLDQAPANSALYPASSALNTRISLVRTDITKLATTCIVNAANTSLLGGGGVDGAIHAAAGPGLYDECLPLHGCPTGSAKITSAHDLPSKHVIHAVGPIYAKAKREGGASRPKELLEGCYRTSLDLAAGLEDAGESGGTSIAFSCLSTGVYGYPSNEAAGVASRCVRDWLEEQDGNDGGGAQVNRVVFCCFLEKDVKAYEEWLPKVFPPTTAELSSTSDEAPQDPEVAEEKLPDHDTSTGNTQSLASTSLASEPALKKQKQTPTTAFTTSSHQNPPPPSSTTTTEDEKEDWEAVERPQHSLASSSIIDSTTLSTASDIDPVSERTGGTLDESTVHVHADPAITTATASKMEEKHALEDEGVEVEKPADLDLEEDEGVKVERPSNGAGSGYGVGSGENLLGKDW